MSCFINSSPRTVAPLLKECWSEVMSGTVVEEEDYDKCINCLPVQAKEKTTLPALMHLRTHDVVTAALEELKGGS